MAGWSAVAAWWGLLGLLAWWLVQLAAARALLGLRHLRRLRPPPPRPWPTLSVIIPACNEVSTLEPALRTLLAADYPSLQLVVVDDRSTDGTGALLDRLAAADPRITPVHVHALPAGWLGKVHALQRGVEHARGDWLLFTDADVHFAPDALRRAVGLAEGAVLDHLSVYPEMRNVPLPTEIVASALGVTFLLLTGAVDAHKEGARASPGVGAFNLVRASTYARSEGLGWLRMEVADDMGLAMLVRRAGGRSMCVGGRGMVAVRWYGCFTELLRGMEKNLFGISCRYELVRCLAIVLGTWAVMAAPWVALTVEMLRMPAVLSLACAVLVALLGRSTLGGRMGAWLLAPLAPWVLGFMLLRSALLCHARGGILWRGTLYPLTELRRAQRVGL